MLFVAGTLGCGGFRLPGLNATLFGSENTGKVLHVGRQETPTKHPKVEQK